MSGASFLEFREKIDKQWPYHAYACYLIDRSLSWLLLFPKSCYIRYCCHISNMCLGEHEKSVLLLQYLRTFRGAFWLLLFQSRESCWSLVLGMFVRGILASKKAPCYFCDICGHLEASLGFFFSKVVNLVKFVILALFATFVRGVLRTKHTLVTNCIYFYLN